MGFFSAHSKDNEPVGWWRGMPVYATTLLVIFYVFAFVFFALLIPFGFSGFVSKLLFSPAPIFSGFEIWRVVTYAFVSPLSLWFLVDMAILYFFGTEIEKFLGRREFFVLYGLLIVVPPAVLTLLWVFGVPVVLAGSGAVLLAVFLAFAAILPEVPLLFGIAAKWVAGVFFVFQSLLSFAGSDWGSFAALWVDACVVFFYLRWCGVRSLQFDFSGLFSVKKGGFRETGGWGGDRAERREGRGSRGGERRLSVDAILEKISVGGLESLTGEERDYLEKEREKMIGRERRS